MVRKQREQIKIKWNDKVKRGIKSNARRTISDSNIKLTGSSLLFSDDFQQSNPLIPCNTIHVKIISFTSYLHSLWSFIVVSFFEFYGPKYKSFAKSLWSINCFISKWPFLSISHEGIERVYVFQIHGIYYWKNGNQSKF